MILNYFYKGERTYFGVSCVKFDKIRCFFFKLALSPLRRHCERNGVERGNPGRRYFGLLRATLPQ